MSGKRGLIMGVANDHSIAWGIAKRLAARRRRARLHLPAAVARQARAAAREIARLGLRHPLRRRARARRCRRSRRARHGVRRARASAGATLDFVVHAIAFSDKNELKGRYADTTRANFMNTMLISCFSFTEVAQARGEADAERRRAADAHLWRLDPGHAELQRHGRRQGGARGVACATSPSISATQQHPRQRDLGRARCARSPAPASPTRG